MEGAGESALVCERCRRADEFAERMALEVRIQVCDLKVGAVEMTKLGFPDPTMSSAMMEPFASACRLLWPVAEEQWMHPSMPDAGSIHSLSRSASTSNSLERRVRSFSELRVMTKPKAKRHFLMEPT